MDNQLDLYAKINSADLEDRELKKALKEITPTMPVECMDCLIEIKARCIHIYDDPCQFNEVAAKIKNEDPESDLLLFGEFQFAKSLMRDCFVGIIKNPKDFSAVAYFIDDDCEVYVYVPKVGELI